MPAAKRALRRAMRKVRDQLSVEHAVAASAQACARVLALPALDGVEMVGVYASIRGELNTRPLTEALLARGAALAFPRVVPGQRRLAFHRVDDLDTLVRSELGIPEPAPSAPAVAIDHIDLFIVPGLAFDRRGQRLGWGAGHYDATLSGSTATRVGYAYDCQLVADVPAGDLDLPMDLIVTEANVIDIGAQD